MQSFFTAKNTTYLQIFTGMEVCGNAQFPPFHKIYAFPQNFHTSKLGKITGVLCIASNCVHYDLITAHKAQP